jgi:hypothetical protein
MRLSGESGKFFIPVLGIRIYRILELNRMDYNDIFSQAKRPVRDEISVERTSHWCTKRPVRDEISVERTSHWCTKRPVRDEISVERTSSLVNETSR